jgi:SAM-dependent methyltransferase
MEKGMSTFLAVRNQAEVERSASEAQKLTPRPIPIHRYLNPPQATPFSLEYAFHLLGDVRGKTVLDLGCGSGNELVVLLARGANVIGIDISPDLIALAKERVGDRALVRVGSAYDTELPDSSVDVIFCISVIHHLDISIVCGEMRRILKPGGFVVLREPIRFSPTYARLRSFLPAPEDASEFEHPLTREELRLLQDGFHSEKLRFFRLPFVALGRWLPVKARSLPSVSGALLKRFPGFRRFATLVVVKLVKKASA